MGRKARQLAAPLRARHTAPKTRLQRANGDTSWLISFGAARYLLDPWLVGSEVAGATWFSQQTLSAAPLAVDQLGRFDAVIVSQPFSDHCHEETLALLDPAVPIYAVAAAARRLSPSFPDRTIVVVPDTEASSDAQPRGVVLPGGVRVSHWPADRWRLDLLHNAILFEPPYAGGNLFYAPHGYQWPPARWPSTTPLPAIDILMCTVATYGLPWFLGGTVNLGLPAAQALATACGAPIVVDTHSEAKVARGLVAWLARPVYPSAKEVQRRMQPRTVVQLDGYRELVLPHASASAAGKQRRRADAVAALTQRQPL